METINHFTYALTEEEQSKAVAALLEVRRAIEFLPETSLEVFLHFVAKCPMHTFGTFRLFLLDTAEETCFSGLPFDYTLTISKMLHLNLVDEIVNDEDSYLAKFYIDDDLTNSVTEKVMPAIYILFKIYGTERFKNIINNLLHSPSEIIKFTMKDVWQLGESLHTDSTTEYLIRYGAIEKLAGDYSELLRTKYGIVVTTDHF